MLDSGVKLTVVECTFGERTPECHHNPHINHIHVKANASSLLWNKESLLNIGIQRLPHDAKYIGTFDADIKFRRKDWAAETVHELQQHHVVQPWSDCYDLGPNGEHLEVHRSFCRLVHDNCHIMQGPNHPKAPYRFGHPGYAWCWTREALEWVGGLVDTASLGAGDHHMALALIGRVDDSIPGYLCDQYKEPLRIWQQRAMKHIAKNISYVPGTIEHNFHGDKAKRYYIDRWEILKKHNFNPVTDIKKNSYGVHELCGNKTGLRDDINKYFLAREEDNSFSW